MSLTKCWFWLLAFACAASASEPGHPKLTPRTAGPYSIRANRILDAHDREYLLRGTTLPAIPVQAPVIAGNTLDFGPFSGTTLITIRQRLNMNAVRLRIHPQEYGANGNYRARVKGIVRRANQFELLAVLEAGRTANTASSAILSFWALCAAEFKTNPNVFFAVSSSPNPSQTVDEIRSRGAAQPIVVTGFGDDIQDSNIIREINPHYASIEADRKLIDSMSERYPLLVNGLDPQLDHAGPECAAFPGDPAKAARLMKDLLRSFDERRVSWTISSLEPGRLMMDGYVGYNWCKLDDGWVCGESPVFAGIGMAVLSHLWSANAHGLLTVNQPAGGLTIARGAHSSAYGRVMAEREVRTAGLPLPVKLGNISVRVKDARGVARLAPMSWTGGGWSNVNFSIPANSAPGVAEVAVVRSDGSKSASEIIVAHVAPGLWTATHNGRGPVIGQVFQRFPNGKTVQFPAWKCTQEGCRTTSIPLSTQCATTVCLEGTGFRFASSKAAILVNIDGIVVPVETYGPVAESSRDVVTVKLPDALIGHGELDLFMVMDGAISNVVRIHCGGSGVAPK